MHVRMPLPSRVINSTAAQCSSNPHSNKSKIQVLLWNYPGQAFSEWREQQLLNNEYLSTILQYLLLHLGKKSNGGTGEK